MGITGLFLCTFLVVHLAGNLGLYVGQEAFNEYTKKMTSNPLIKIVEVVLALGFLTHIIDGVMLWVQNRKARPEKYAYNSGKAKKGSAWARTMAYSGTVILVFLVIHIASFWYELHYGDIPVTSNGFKDMYTVVVEAFGQWWYSALYVVSMLLLASHLNHGFQSAFRTLGFHHPKYLSNLQKAGTIFAVIMTVGFASFPVYFFFTQL